uniref:Metalloendopeptidase n=1 Tax=Scleropages formosus TaxID=113540 RepID=B1B568_SCLFO|nr:hatching enzyme [Scleropages formosus]BAI68350.1 hatching enzyme [Scleropages formosus]
MEGQLTCTILALLLSFSQANPLMDLQIEDDVQPEDPEHVDITTRILQTNNGSSQVLLEGDLLVLNTRNAMICYLNSCLWKKSANGLVEVPYVLSNDFSNVQKQLIESAMRDFSSLTCIRFVLHGTQSDYISIENLDGCYSVLGRTGGKQLVSLNKYSCVYYGIIQHELNHALCFYHEHTRSDRDQYVRINWQYVDPSQYYNFEKQNTNNQNTPYDYGSVMHYGRTAFTIQYGMETITPIPDPTVPIGQMNGLSQMDVLRINKLYGC